MSKEQRDGFTFVYLLWESDRKDWAGHYVKAYESNIGATFEEAYYNANPKFPWDISEDLKERHQRILQNKECHMNALTLLHGSLEPLIYGLVIFMGIISMFYKLINGHILSFFIEIGVFWLVFKLHSGTMTGGFAATLAALLCGVIIPWMINSKFRK